MTLSLSYISLGSVLFSYPIQVAVLNFSGPHHFQSPHPTLAHCPVLQARNLLYGWVSGSARRFGVCKKLCEEGRRAGSHWNAGRCRAAAMAAKTADAFALTTDATVVIALACTTILFTLSHSLVLTIRHPPLLSTAFYHSDNGGALTNCPTWHVHQAKKLP